MAGRPGTSRPVTTSGRFVRLGTASMLAEPGGPFINVDKLVGRTDLVTHHLPCSVKVCRYTIMTAHNWFLVGTF